MATMVLVSLHTLFYYARMMSSAQARGTASSAEYWKCKHDDYLQTCMMVDGETIDWEDSSAKT